MIKTNSLKKCSVCNKLKLASNLFFGKDKRHLDGLEARCKLCRKDWSKNHYEANKSRLLTQSKLYYKKDLSKSRLLRSKYYFNNKEDILRKARIKAKTEIARHKTNTRIKQKYALNLEFRLKQVLRARIRTALKNNYKTGTTVKNLGCSINVLKEYLSSKFTEGMTWENWGMYGWHIDHIKPLDSFDLTNEKEFLEACHYTNLQPLWAKDNLSKGSKLPHERRAKYIPTSSRTDKDVLFSK